MAIKTFAAIDLGSFEIAIKIFEISKNTVKEIDHVRHRIELGTDTYNTGKISYERMDELCSVLTKFKTVMETYGVTEYKAYATSAIRETENTAIVLDQIKLRTGLTVEVVSNAEQRFINYKSVALNSDRFSQIIKSDTAFLDIGGGSVQISLFKDSKLIGTTNVNLGVLRIREQIASLAIRTNKYEKLLEEMIDNELDIFSKLYLKGLDVKNLIVVDDYISYIFNKISQLEEKNMVTGDEFVSFIEEIKLKSPEMIAKQIGLPPENASLLLPSALLIKHFIESTGASLLWLPGVSLGDGIAYDYAQAQGLLKSGHDFEADILSSATMISKRFKGGKTRGATLKQSALAIFDAIKKEKGLSERERLLLQLSVIMRDCGKYISTQGPISVAECSQDIIMHTEIIGISHREREMVALIVRNSYLLYIDYEELSSARAIRNAEYLTVAKLAAIIQTAAGLARSKRKSLVKVSAALKDRKLVITAVTKDDMTLEEGLFNDRTSFFEEVFGIIPVLKIKKS